MWGVYTTFLESTAVIDQNSDQNLINGGTGRWKMNFEVRDQTDLVNYFNNGGPGMINFSNFGDPAPPVQVSYNWGFWVRYPDGHNPAWGT